MIRIITPLILIFVFTFSATGQNSRAKKNKNGAFTYLYPNDVERAKHMRPEFINSYKFIDRKRLKKENSENLTQKGHHQQNITKLKDTIKYYESFSGINEWEKAEILSTKANLAKAEKRYQEAINYLWAIVQGGHATEKTMRRHYYGLYELLFVQKDYMNAGNFLMKAFSLKYPILPWDFANLAEMSFRNNKHADGVKLLARAIQDMRANNCPVEEKWINFQKNLSDNPTGDSLKELLNSKNPWFYTTILDKDPIPIVRREPIYLRGAQERRMNGHITLSFIVNNKGSVVCSFLVEGAGKEFLKPSKKAASKFKYRPLILNGKPSWIYGVKTRFTFQIG